MDEITAEHERDVVTRVLWCKRVEDGVVYYYEPSYRYRIQRHEVDDRWDTGALVPFSVQWVREERTVGGWLPVEIHHRLGDAKAAAERRLESAA